MSFEDIEDLRKIYYDNYIDQLNVKYAVMVIVLKFGMSDGEEERWRSIEN